MSPMLNRDFREFAGLLDARGVDYLIVGGYALAAHGHPRYTGDIDFWVRPEPQNIARLLQALQDFGFGSLGLSAADFVADSVVQLGQPPRRIDLLTSIDGVDFAACFTRRDSVVVDGVRLDIIGLEDFKTNKRAAGRLKDLADLESLGLARSFESERKPPTPQA
jgi:predicted nucleotidyltransferase